MTQKKKIKFIINPISGTRSKKKIPAMIDEVIDHNKFETELLVTQYAGHAAELTQQAVSEGTDIVVAIGGDGTVNEVARSLINTPTALAIVPCGSGNGLARHLCLPMDVRRALQIINSAHIETFDYGVINNHPFFCTCGMGFDAYISLKFAQAGKRGLVTYVKNVLKAGLNYKSEIYEVEDETGTRHYKAFLIACANASQYGNNAYIAPGATMKDGLMDVVVMEPFGLFNAMKLGAGLFLKTLKKNAKVKTFRAKSIHIHRSQPGAIHFDGDPIMEGCDIDVRIEHMGIRIVSNPDKIEDIS